MSDQGVNLLLKHWGVPQLADRCQEQEVDLDALRSFKEDVIAELVPHIGPRCKFLKGWRAWQDAGAPDPGSALDGGLQETSTSGSCLSVFGLGPTTTEQQLRQIFSKYGPIDSVDGQTGRPRGFSFIHFQNVDGAKSAKEQCSGLEIDGRRVILDLHHSSQDRTPTPGMCGTSSPALSPAGPVPSVPPGHSDQQPTPFQTEFVQCGATEEGPRKEVLLRLEGKITYDDTDESGWLSASGFMLPDDGAAVTGRNRGAPHGPTWDNPVIKIEPSETEVNPSGGRHGPKFTLQGRISLSPQDFLQIPSFMLQEPTSSASFDDFQDADVLSILPSSSTVAPQPLAADVLCDTRRMAPPGAAAGRSKRSRSEKLDLETLLNSSSKGKMVLSLYNQRGCLDGPSRQTLTDLIIAEELREDLNRRIPSQRFQEIAEAIVELFPGENEDTYFSTDRSGFGERPNGKGKLTSKYYNTRRQLAKTGVICRGHKERRHQVQQGTTLASLQMTPVDEKTALQNIMWLRSVELPVSASQGEAILEKWRTCWKLRMQRVLSQGHSPAAYIEEFPLLLSAIGNSLISMDFDLLLKNVGNRLLNDWPAFSQNVYTILSADHYRKQLPLLDIIKRTTTTEIGRQYGALLLLSNMLPVTTCKGTGENAELWRPTRQEAQNGFLLHVREDDWYGALEDHRARMRVMGQSICPLPIIVGKSLDALEMAMVALESTTFVVPSALHAVDLCFKCFHALQIPYPPQSQNAWLLLQHAVYQMAVPTDRMSVAVSSLLADFGVRPIPPVMSWDHVIS